MTTYTTTPAKMHSGHDIRDTSGSMVAIVHNPAADPAKGARIAALMSAAPEMLSALMAILDDASSTHPKFTLDYKVQQCVQIARAAIARAQGVAQ